MANNTVAEIEVSLGAASGAVFWAPLGTPVPTDATTALNAAFKNLGYVGEDGITKTREVSSEPVNDMNGNRLLDIQSDFSVGYEARMLQTLNVDLNKMVFGDANVTVTAATSTTGTKTAIVDRGRMSDKGVLVVQTYSGLAVRRQVAAVAQPTASVPDPFRGNAVQAYTVTWAVYPDDAGGYVYEYHDNGVFSA